MPQETLNLGQTFVAYHGSFLQALAAVCYIMTADDALKHDPNLMITRNTLSGFVKVAEQLDPELRHLRDDPFARIKNEATL